VVGHFNITRRPSGRHNIGELKMTMPHQFELIYHLKGKSQKTVRKTFATEELLDDYMIELDDDLGLKNLVVRYVNHHLNLEVYFDRQTYKSS
jgi:hypothetical protein